MTLPVKHFTSQMRGAPVLNGTAGSLIAVLDACLVTGFGLVTASSVTISGGIATASIPSGTPISPGSVILVAGATPAGLNGEQRAVASSATTVAWATALADGAASGTITIKLAAAGWVKPFTGTNLAVFRSTDVQAHGGGMCLRVDDTAAQMARVVGYESMGDVNTGSGPFPAPAQMSGGGYWSKSSLASAAPVHWVVAADSRFVLIHIVPYSAGSTSHLAGVTRGFGDFLPRRPSGDPFATGLNYSGASVLATQGDGGFDVDRGTTRTALARSYSGLGGAVMHVSPAYTGANVASGADATLGSFPSPVSGEMFLSRGYVSEAGGPPRAGVPGLLTIPQSFVGNSLRLFDKVPGTGDLVGRELLVVSTHAAGLSSATIGAALIDITGPWR